MADGRASGAQAYLERVIAQLATALNTRALYGPNHPNLIHAVDQLLEAVVAVCDDRHQDSVTFFLPGHELMVDDRPLQKGGLHQQPVIKTFKRRGIERLTLGRRLEPSECRQFLDTLVGGGIPTTTANLVVGQFEVAFPEGEHEGEGLTPALVDSAQDTFLMFRADRRAGLGRLDELVWGFTDALSRSTRTILRLAPVKNHDEYTFVHSVNVSLLVLAQAQSFGIEGELLHSIGVAALLHDVGKLGMPVEVLNKPGRLDGEEWKIMMMHAELGAWDLATLEPSSPLSVLVAYEHHLRFDGRRSYPVLKTPRRPTLASQLTAVADVYDAICTVRPYRKALSRQAALDVLRARAGTFHDPYLVGNFFRLLGVG